VRSLSFEEILALEDEELTEAITPPNHSYHANIIFTFLQQYSHSCIILAGGGGVAGIDIDKLESLALRRGIELDRYNMIVLDYCQEWIESANSSLKQSSKKSV
jgi:hypothetical protein